MYEQPDFSDRNREIARAYLEDELSLKQLARIHGVTSERIRQLLAKQGVTLRPQGRPPGPVSRARRERQEAMKSRISSE